MGLQNGSYRRSTRPKTGILPGDARARLAFAEQMPKCPQERIKDV